MQFHTAMIILHRPPRHLLSEPGISTSEDVEICYESLQALFRLMRSYSRFYHYKCLPLDFVHTLSVAASTVFLKRRLDDTPWDEAKTTNSLALILEAMHAVKETWPCVAEIESGIIKVSQEQPSDIPESSSVMDVGFMAALTGFASASDMDTWSSANYDGTAFQADIGPLLTNEVLGGIFPSNPGYGQ